MRTTKAATKPSTIMIRTPNPIAAKDSPDKRVECEKATVGAKNSANSSSTIKTTGDHENRCATGKASFRSPQTVPGLDDLSAVVNNVVEKDEFRSGRDPQKHQQNGGNSHDRTKISGSQMRASPASRKRSPPECKLVRPGKSSSSMIHFHSPPPALSTKAGQPHRKSEHQPLREVKGAPEDVFHPLPCSGQRFEIGDVHRSSIQPGPPIVAGATARRVSQLIGEASTAPSNPSNGQMLHSVRKLESMFFERPAQQLGEMDGRGPRKIRNLVTATGSRSDHRDLRRETINRRNQRPRHLERQLPVFCEHPESAGHTATTGLQPSHRSSRYLFQQSTAAPRRRQGLGVAVAMDRDFTHRRGESAGPWLGFRSSRAGSLRRENTAPRPHRLRVSPTAGTRLTNMDQHDGSRKMIGFGLSAQEREIVLGGPADFVEKASAGGRPAAAHPALGKIGLETKCFEHCNRGLADARLVIPHPGVVPENHPAPVACGRLRAPGKPPIESLGGEAGNRRVGIEAEDPLHDPSRERPLQSGVRKAGHDGAESPEKIGRRRWPGRSAGHRLPGGAHAPSRP